MPIVIILVVIILVVIMMQSWQSVEMIYQANLKASCVYTAQTKNIPLTTVTFM